MHNFSTAFLLVLNKYNARPDNGVPDKVFDKIKSQLDKLQIFEPIEWKQILPGGSEGKMRLKGLELLPGMENKLLPGKKDKNGEHDHAALANAIQKKLDSVENGACKIVLRVVVCLWYV